MCSQQTRQRLQDAFAGVVTADLGVMDAAAVGRVLDAVRDLEGFLSGVKVAGGRRLSQLRQAGQAGRAETTVGRLFGKREARKLEERTAVLDDAPSIEQALADGEATTAHVDAVAAAVKITPAVLDHQDELADKARLLPPDEFADVCKRMAYLLAEDGGLQVLERQRKDTTARRWVDPFSGMYCVSGRFDPERGAQLWASWDAAVEAHFHAGVEPGLSNDQRAAVALYALVTRPGGPHRRAPRPAGGTAGTRGSTAGASGDGPGDAVPGGWTPAGDTSGGDSGAGDPVSGSASQCWLGNRPGATVHVHVDLETLVSGLHGRSVIDVTGGGTLPVDTIRRMACEAEVIPYVLSGDGVVLDVGRAKRLATWRQRHALRAMYSTCAIDGCAVAFAHCRIHHIAPFDTGGTTDLENLLPVCDRHHHDLHEGRWTARLEATTRELTITRPDGHTTITPLRRPPP